MRVTVVMPRLHPKQREVVYSGERFKIACCGRRWGKTTAAIVWLLVRPPHGVLVAPYTQAAWFAPTFRMAEHVYRKIASATQELIVSASANVMSLEFRNGSRVLFFSMENIRAARGRGFSRVVIDEAAHAPNLEETWLTVIRPTLLDTTGDALFISTPNGFNYFYDLFNRARASSDWFTMQSPTWDNPWIDSSEIEAMRSQLDPLSFAQEIGAEFVALQGGMLNPSLVQYAECSEPETFAIGVDPAASSARSADYTAIVVAAVSAGKYYVCDAHLIRQEGTAVLDHIRQVYERYSAIAPTLVFVESVATQRILLSFLRREVPVAVGAIPKTGKQVRFMPIVELYSRSQIVHHPKLRGSLFEAQLFSFPHGEHDDAVDALCYAIYPLTARSTSVRRMVAFV